MLIISDANMIQSRAYMHMHKLHEIPDDWTLIGQYEAHYIKEKLTLPVESETDGPEVKKIFKEKFHFTWDNFFSGNVIMD